METKQFRGLKVGDLVRHAGRDDGCALVIVAKHFPYGADGLPTYVALRTQMLANPHEWSQVNEAGQVIGGKTIDQLRAEEGLEPLAPTNRQMLVELERYKSAGPEEDAFRCAIALAMKGHSVHFIAPLRMEAMTERFLGMIDPDAVGWLPTMRTVTVRGGGRIVLRREDLSQDEPRKRDLMGLQHIVLHPACAGDYSGLRVRSAPFVHDHVAPDITREAATLFDSEREVIFEHVGPITLQSAFESRLDIPRPIATHDRIKIEPFPLKVMSPDGTGRHVSYGGGEIENLKAETLYHVFAYDPEQQGGAVTYHATEKLQAYAIDVRYMYVGAVTTLKAPDPHAARVHDAINTANRS